jgi:hypothetical protein
MSQIIRLTDHRRRRPPEYAIVKKIVDGEIIECVDIDALPPDRISEFLAIEEAK